VKENNILPSSMSYRIATQHYGVIQKRSSGLMPFVFSALPPGVVMEKDFYPPTGGNVFQETFVALLRLELRFP
jgi:hypothetical protein